MLRNKLIVGVALAATVASGFVGYNQTPAPVRVSAEGPVTAQVSTAKVAAFLPINRAKTPEAPVKAAEPVAQPVAVAPVQQAVAQPVVVAPAIDWSADAWQAFQTDGIAPSVLWQAFRATYLGTWSDRVHFGTKNVVVIESAAHRGFFHFFAVSTGKPVANPGTCESKGMITAEDHTCVPSSFYAGAAMGNAGKGAPVGPPPAGVTVSPVYGQPPYTEGNCPPGMKNMSQAGCPAAPPVDTCEADLNDLLTADSSVSADKVTAMHSDGKHCTISVSR